MTDDVPLSYPPEVLRYGDADKRLYDQELHLLMATFTEALARATLADPEYWHIITSAAYLHPVHESMEGDHDDQ